MGKLISGWFTLLLFGLFIYTPIFIITNSTDDEMEELTYQDIIPSFSSSRITEDQIERKIFILEKLGVETNKELLDALEDIDEVSDIETIVSPTKEGKLESGDMFDSTLNKAIIKFSYKNKINLIISAQIIEKSYFNFRPTTLLVLESVKITGLGEYNSNEMIDFFDHLFKDESPTIYFPSRFKVYGKEAIKQRKGNKPAPVNGIDWYWDNRTNQWIEDDTGMGADYAG